MHTYTALDVTRTKPDRLSFTVISSPTILSSAGRHFNLPSGLRTLDFLKKKPWRRVLASSSRETSGTIAPNASLWTRTEHPALRKTTFSLWVFAPQRYMHFLFSYPAHCSSSSQIFLGRRAYDLNYNMQAAALVAVRNLRPQLPVGPLHEVARRCWASLAEDRPTADKAFDWFTAVRLGNRLTLPTFEDRGFSLE